MNKRSKAFLISVLSFLMLCIYTGIAYGATLSQTSCTTNSITVSWTDLSDSGRYKITNMKALIGTEYNQYSEVGSPSNGATSFTFNNLKPGTKYYVKITYDRTSTTYANASTYNYYMSTSSTCTLPGKVTHLTQDRWYYFALSFYATWDKQTGVSGYEYIVKNNKGKTVASGKNSYTSFNVDHISNNIIYTGQVRAYSVINGITYYGEWSDPVNFFTQPRITSLKATNGKLTVKWGKVGGATGYDVYVSTAKDPKTGYKKVKSVKASKNSVTITKFRGKKINKKKTYYVYIVTKKGSANSGRLYYWNSKKSANSFGYF